MLFPLIVIAFIEFKFNYGAKIRIIFESAKEMEKIMII